MPRFITSVAMAINGDRFEKGAEVELAEEEAARYDASDLVLVGPVAEVDPVPEEEVAVEEMTLPQLKVKAGELGLVATGSKADLVERITLHLAASTPAGEGAVVD